MPDTVVESVTVQKGELRIIYLFRDEGMGGGGDVVLLVAMGDWREVVA